ncbi:enoyl-CoA hydratase-related protein [Alkalicoccus daliensis]|uniref:Enoyl-CoA hydratase/carnithine racemase n=1 Tax=Alkalicoccus daliensis TaxID=745820 RepID=A0A1H0IDG4_9BACI|nr:enoyl-CoA hydratase-related protein [Alkalicoccus daliensis]SDO29509.1 Enoyl-CoA hydratase/carnithine racemase [Alkalicoccus daliensis]
MIQAKVEEGLAILTLDRAEAANALSNELIEKAVQVLQEWHESQSIKAVIITGSGDRVFCAGADLKERAGMNPDEVRAAVKNIRNFIEKVYEMPQPVIAAINGAAIGGGVELALACDFRIAVQYATFSLAETGLGIIPGAGGTQRLPRLIGEQKAKELILTGKKISAEEAVYSGLVLKAFSRSELLPEAEHFARIIASRAPLANRYAKSAINQGLQKTLQEGLQVEQAEYEKTINTKDRLEGLAAFKEKRPPVFRGE